MRDAPASTPAAVFQRAGSADAGAAYPRYSADNRRTAATTNDRRGLRRGLTGTAFRTGSVVPVPHR